jgi:hypothetical protein
LVATAGARELEELRLAKFNYYLDESDPDIVILPRQDGTFVAAFRSARGATREGILEASKEDHGLLIAAYVAWQQGQSTERQRNHQSA